MNLTADQFAQILQTLDLPRVEREADQRRAARVLHRCRVPVMLGTDADEGVATVVTVRDFSSRGICLLHGKPLPAGTNFVVRLATERRSPISILCTVAYCRAEGKSLFVIGAEFTCVLDKEAAPRPEGTASAEVTRIRSSMLG